MSAEKITRFYQSTPLYIVLSRIFYEAAEIFTRDELDSAEKIKNGFIGEKYGNKYYLTMSIN